MEDIYRELAGAVLGKTAGDVTAAERRAAKLAFWATFYRVAQLPGNEPLRATTVPPWP
jgi:hypothetical protein